MHTLHTLHSRAPPPLHLTLQDHHNLAAVSKFILHHNWHRPLLLPLPSMEGVISWHSGREDRLITTTTEHTCHTIQDNLFTVDKVCDTKLNCIHVSQSHHTQSADNNHHTNIIYKHYAIKHDAQRYNYMHFARPCSASHHPTTYIHDRVEHLSLHWLSDEWPLPKRSWSQSEQQLLQWEELQHTRTRWGSHTSLQFIRARIKGLPHEP